MSSTVSKFGGVDLVLFAGCLILAAVIGIFYAYKDRKKNSTENYLYADGKMKMVLVSISMAVSWASALTVLALPGDVYLFGSVYMWLLPGVYVGNTITAVYFVPLIHKLQISTMFEFLEMRFNRTLRVVSSLASNLQLLTYMGIATYLPALALTVVTPLTLEWSIIITGTICTFYTSLGGIKAVIWTDILQSIIMIVGMSLAFIKITMQVGGLHVIQEVSQRSNRSNFFKFTWDPRVATSSPALFFGFLYITWYGSAVNQLMVQRYLCCKTPKKAIQALAIHLVIVSVFVLLSCGNGLAMLTYYEDCDPKEFGIVDKIEQILPLLVVNVFKSIPGIAGIFVAAVYSGTLSSVSSGVNSMASLILNDIVLVIRPTLSIKRRLIISKIASACAGLTVMVMAYGASRSSSTMFQLNLALHGALCGPILGITLLGVFVPWSNSKGANIAIICGITFGLWIIIGNIFVRGNPSFRETLPMRTDGCLKTFNITWANKTIPTVSVNVTEISYTSNWSNRVLSNSLYSINSFYVGVFTSSLTLLAGLIATIFTRRNPKDLDPALFVPLISGTWWPESVKRFFRCGVKYEDPNKKHCTENYEMNDEKLLSNKVEC